MAPGVAAAGEANGGSRLETATTLGFPVPMSAAKAWTSLNKYLLGIDIDAIEDGALELAEHARTHLRLSRDRTLHIVPGSPQRRHDDDAQMLVGEALKLLEEGQQGNFHPAFRIELVQAAGVRRAVAMSCVGVEGARGR